MFAKTIIMGDKIQLSFKLDSDVIAELDKTILDFKGVTGAKLIRQECIEASIKDYIVKLRSQVELLQTKKPSE